MYGSWKRGYGVDVGGQVDHLGLWFGVLFVYMCVVSFSFRYNVFVLLLRRFHLFGLVFYLLV